MTRALRDPEVPLEGWCCGHYFPSVRILDERYNGRYSGQSACREDSFDWDEDWKRTFRRGGHAVVPSPLAPVPSFDPEPPCWKCLVEAPLNRCTGKDLGDGIWAHATVRAILLGIQEDVRRKNVSARQLAVWIDRGVDRCIELVEAP